MMLRVLLLLLLALAWAGCGERSATRHELRVGMELSYPPFEMTDERGAPAGVSVDLAHDLGKALQREVIIENIPFHGLIPALQTGKVDLVISSMTATPERAQTIDFSEPYVSTGLALLAGAKTSIQSAADLEKGQPTVAVKKGTTGYLWASEHLKNARLLVLEKEHACILEVAQGKADVFIYDQLSTWKAAKENPESTRPLLTPFQKETWAIGLRKGDQELRTQVNEFLAKYRQEGGFERLGDRWLGEQKKAFQELGVPFVF
jgi:polar amino acid transport system substrate-binding protein